MRSIALAYLASSFGIACCNESLKQSLDDVIRKCITPGYGLHDEQLAISIRDWPGIGKTEGIDALFQYWIDSTGEYKKISDSGVWKNRAPTLEELIVSYKNAACLSVRDRLSVPDEAVVTYLLSKLTESDTISTEMIYLRHLLHYFDDIRVPSSYVGYLSDKRLIDEVRPLASGYRMRACDGVSNLILLGFEKAGKLKMGEAGIIGDTLNQSDFDHNIAALRPYLIDLGVIGATDPYPPRPGHSTGIPRTHGTSGSGQATKDVPRPKPGPDEKTLRWTWWHGAGILLVLAALARLIKGRRRHPDAGK